jgi:DNA-binding CsgD family transcriptional regulator
MLFGRGRELSVIGTLLERARLGSSGVLVLVGEAGIGKSALLEHAAESAEGMAVLRARGVESEAQIPFSGLFELLRPALGSIERLPRPQAGALASALALRPAHAHDRFAVGAATLSLLAAYAESAPLLVLVDDAHWLDGSSADALRFALRRLVADPIAAVLTVREDEPSLVDRSDLTTLTVGGLELEAAAELLRAAAPGTTRDAAARLHRETAGNPLALLELAREHAPEVPLAMPLPAVSSVGRTYLHRAHQLPERSQAALLLAAASDGGELSILARAAAALGVDVADLLPAEASGLVELGPERVTFRHPLVRSAIYGGSAPEQRRAAHRALADALPDAEADRRAWHLAVAAVGPDERASSALEQAGARARDRSAYDVSSRAFERAALLAPAERRRASLAYAAADTAWLGGLADRARSLLEEAARHADGGPLKIRIEHLRGHVALRRGPIEAGRAILAAAAERAAEEDVETAVVMLAEAAEGAFFAADAAGVRACGERAAALGAGAANARTAFFARLAAGMGRILSGEGDDGAVLIRDAVAVLERSDEFVDDPRLLAWAAMGPLWLREAGAGDGLAERAVAIARSHAAAGALPHLLTHVGIEEAASDRFVEAHATFDEAIRLARETGQRTILAGALARLAWVEARCGRARDCRDHAEEALALARELGAHLFEIWARAALGELELARGDVAAALARFDEQQEALDGYGISDVDLSPAPERVELCLRVGRRADAVALAASFLEAARAKSQPWALARAMRASARVAADDEFAAAFEEALALHARTPDVFETARTELAYGVRLRRAGRRRDARGRLRVALDAFDRLGASPWAERARSELAATGETARRRDASTLDELTPQELKVSLLLAEGKTTREAAAALFLSPKTIEYHLRSAYRKLGVNSRGELAEALVRA